VAPKFVLDVVSLTVNQAVLNAVLLLILRLPSAQERT
jgi:hypothetical protein